MPVDLPKGTKEYVVVEVTDALNNLVTLEGTTPKFDVKYQDESFKITQGTPVIQIMKLFCMIDTRTVPGDWPAGDYRIYVDFTTAPELPRIGPFPFSVDAS
jgi:hypothetical protein